jgi:hypothetical protein
MAEARRPETEAAAEAAAAAAAAAAEAEQDEEVLFLQEVEEEEASELPFGGMQLIGESPGIRYRQGGARRRACSRKCSGGTGSWQPPCNAAACRRSRQSWGIIV